MPLPQLPVEDVRLLRLSVAIVQGTWDEVRAVRAAGEPDLRWREAVLQTHLFAGFPRLVEAFYVLTRAGGLGTPEPSEYAPERPDAQDLDTGYTLFAQIYAKRAPEVREMLEEAHPELARWTIGHAYGRVLSRPGLDPGFRETLAVACLAAFHQDRQLASHARGAQHLGVPLAHLHAAVDAVGDLMPEAARTDAHAVLDRYAVTPDAAPPKNSGDASAQGSA